MVTKDNCYRYMNVLMPFFEMCIERPNDSIVVKLKQLRPASFRQIMKGMIACIKSVPDRLPFQDRHMEILRWWMGVVSRHDLDESRYIYQLVPRTKQYRKTWGTVYDHPFGFSEEIILIESAEAFAGSQEVVEVVPITKGLRIEQRENVWDEKLFYAILEFKKRKWVTQVMIFTGITLEEIPDHSDYPDTQILEDDGKIVLL